jgi:hypothetical protein
MDSKARFDTRTSNLAQISRYEICIYGFQPEEHPDAPLYPEDAFFLRFWHPIYEDYVDITCYELKKAHGDGYLRKSVEFRFPRKSFQRAYQVEVPDSAVFGVCMYARTKNTNGQLCIKHNGVATPEIPFWPIHRQKIYERSVEIVSHHLESEMRGETQSLYKSTKARIRKLSISLITTGTFAYTDCRSENILVREHKLFQSCMSRMIRESYKPAFLSLNRAHPPKIQGYFSPQYMTNGGDVLPTSSYMIRTCMEDTMRPDVDYLARCLDACILQHPEMGGEKEFVRISRIYLSSSSEDPSNGDHEIRRKWFTCMEIALAMTCSYNNSVPYLMDMEQKRKDPGPGRRPNPNHLYANASAEADQKEHVEVERMVDAEKDYGHDCEDSSMNANMRKLTLDLDRLRLNGIWSSLPDPIKIVAEIYNLFRAVVTQMFCGGKDDQTEKDDGIFHFCTIFIPKAYLHRMEENGKIPDAYRDPSRFDKLRAWERNYRVGFDRNGNPTGHIGVMYGEGTNTVCPSQFAYDPIVDEGRRDMESFMACCDSALQDIQEWVNIYHANVYARSRKHLSTFYKHAISCFSGDGAHHRAHGVYDYMFSTVHRQKSYGVSVERLAMGDDSVSLVFIEKMRYGEKEMEALESSFTFRSMAYGVFHTPPELERILGQLSHCPGLRETDLSGGGASGIPHFNLENPVERYRYLRLSPLDVDLQIPDRRNRIVSAIQTIIKKSRMKITGLKVYGHILHCVPMDPTTMSGPTPLCSVDILIFFEPSFVDTMQKRLESMWN